jgi:hypothetical protein
MIYLIHGKKFCKSHNVPPRSTKKKKKKKGSLGYIARPCLKREEKKRNRKEDGREGREEKGGRKDKGEHHYLV